MRAYLTSAGIAALILCVPLVLALLLAGCSRPDNIPLGKDQAPPTGAIQFCKDHPDDELCQ
jgi:hypothetical protein